MITIAELTMCHVPRVEKQDVSSVGAGHGQGRVKHLTI